MQSKITKFILLLSVLTLVFLFLRKFIAEQPSNPTATVEEEPSIYIDTLPSDFITFHDRFHTDSIFQMERIAWPLAGIISADDSTSAVRQVVYRPEDWKLHRSFNDYGGTFQQAFTNAQGIITEVITSRDRQFNMRKRYIKTSDGWKLTYYQDLMMAR